MKLKYYFLSIRPKVLFISLGPVILGICLSFNTSLTTDYKYYLIIFTLFLSVLSIQSATHFFNDAYDFLKGADSPKRKGPQRMIQQGLLSVKESLIAGFTCLFIATLSGGFLVLQSGWPILIIGISGMALAYFYTAGPYPLAYTGLFSDIFVVLFFGILAVMGVEYILTGNWSTDAFISGLQLGLLALCLLVTNNLRDKTEDRQAGKKTLVVRFGKKFGLIEWSFAQYLPYFIGYYWWYTTIQSHQPYVSYLPFQLFWLFYLPFILLPLSFYIHYHLIKNPDKTRDKFNKVLTLCCIHHFLFTWLLCLHHFLSTWLSSIIGIIKG